MRVIRVSAHAPSRAALDEAAELLRSGELVAFPTETVYGLGGNALDARAVQRIYDVKGRPGINPLIVHVASIDQARALSSKWTRVANALAEALWPGPLTIVVEKTAAIPAIVSAGGDTIGLRVPAHPVALALLAVARIPIAAPSANLSNQVSPTTAQHVVDGLGDRVGLILDAGPTTVGIESTVVDATGATPRILRPGMISREEIAHLVGAVASDPPAPAHDVSVPRSPGLLGRHYAPRGAVRLFDTTEADTIAAEARRLVATGSRIGAMVFTSLEVPAVREFAMPTSAGDYARLLYATLHTLDHAGSDVILIERPAATDEWSGVVDRLERAARG